MNIYIYKNSPNKNSIHENICISVYLPVFIYYFLKIINALGVIFGPPVRNMSAGDVLKKN